VVGSDPQRVASELAKTPAGRAEAERTFRAHHKGYHSIAAKMVARDLGITDLV
jgi:hypothetical protein